MCKQGSHILKKKKLDALIPFRFQHVHRQDTECTARGSCSAVMSARRTLNRKGEFQKYLFKNFSVTLEFDLHSH